jgi:signal transduction histidine kinase
MIIKDISGSINITILKEEKKLLELINGQVSHEMRNPLNSISSQNILQSQLNM